MDKMRSISVSVSEDQYMKIKKVAEKEDRSIGGLLRYLGLKAAEEEGF